MLSNYPKCITFVTNENKCQTCKNLVIKHGKSANGKQRLRCKLCNKTIVSHYSYSAYLPEINLWIKNYLIKGLGIRANSELLKISSNTVLRRLISIANSINKPIISMKQTYELDEMKTFIGIKSKHTWIVYAINKQTKQVVDFSVGARTNKTLLKVIDSLIYSDASQISTDKLKNYNYLIPRHIHSTKKRGTNHIERKNLTIRTHLKRLNRKLICFSKSKLILSACLKIYFWG